MLVNLATLSVLSQKTPQNPHPPQPHDFGGHPGLRGTLPLTGTSVSTETLGGNVVPCSGTRVHVGGFDDASRSDLALWLLPQKLTCDHLSRAFELPIANWLD